MRIFSFFLLLFIACQPQASTGKIGAQNTFFDLKTFFEKEIGSLESIKAIKKKVIIDGVVEEQERKTFNLLEELASFIDADINRPAWLDQYEVDSIVNDEQQLQAIHYKALKPTLKTKELAITFEKEEVTRINIQRGLSNMAATSVQELIYTSGKGYSIKKEQSLVFSTPKILTIEVKYIH